MDVKIDKGGFSGEYNYEIPKLNDGSRHGISQWWFCDNNRTSKERKSIQTNSFGIHNGIMIWFNYEY